jgi:hypothetical protein
VLLFPNMLLFPLLLPHLIPTKYMQRVHAGPELLVGWPRFILPSRGDRHPLVWAAAVTRPVSMRNSPSPSPLRLGLCIFCVHASTTALCAGCGGLATISNLNCLHRAIRICSLNCVRCNNYRTFSSLFVTDSAARMF